MLNAIMAITFTAGVFGLLAVAFFIFEWSKFIVGTVIDEHKNI